MLNLFYHIRSKKARIFHLLSNCCNSTTYGGLRETEKGYKRGKSFKSKGNSYVIMHVFNYNRTETRLILTRFDKMLRNEKYTGEGKGYSFTSPTWFYNYFLKGGNKIMNKCLQNLLATYYDDMIFSLGIEGIDLHTANWNTEIVNQNAYKGAGILIEVTSRHMEYCDAFLQAIIAGCRRESTMMDTMEIICAVFEHINALPPLGIIQHTLHPELLKIYCADLATWLKKYLQNSSDSVSLHPGFMVKSLK